MTHSMKNVYQNTHKKKLITNPIRAPNNTFFSAQLTITRKLFLLFNSLFLSCCIIFFVNVYLEVNIVPKVHTLD